MADKDNVEKRDPQNNFEKKRKDLEWTNDLNGTNARISEETLTGSAAIKFYDLIFNPKPDLKREKIIKEALALFPEPEKSKELEIDL